MEADRWAKVTLPIGLLLALSSGLSLFGIGMLAGTVWGLANFYLMKYLVESLRQPLQFYSLLFVKFPLLYFLGYELLKLFPPLGLTVGFSIVIASILGVTLWELKRA